MILNREQLDTLGLEIYWHNEHGETGQIISKLNMLQVAGMQRIADLVPANLYNVIQPIHAEIKKVYELWDETKPKPFPTKFYIGQRVTASGCLATIEAISTSGWHMLKFDGKPPHCCNYYGEHELEPA